MILGIDTVTVRIVPLPVTPLFSLKLTELEYALSIAIVATSLRELFDNSIIQNLRK